MVNINPNRESCMEYMKELISKYPNGLSAITKIDFKGIEE